MTNDFEEDETNVDTPCFKCMEKSSCKVYPEGHCPKHYNKQPT